MFSNKNKLSIFTWNVSGIMSSAAYLSDILLEGKIDVCGLSEHWLTTSNLFFLTLFQVIMTIVVHVTLLITEKAECPNVE